ncbi:MAG: acyltransferase [Pseudomonadota bacterium]
MLQQLTGVIALIAVVSNIVFWFIPIMVFAIVRFVLPFAAVRRFTSRMLMACGENWISVNSWLLETTQGTKFHITGTENLRRQEWYLIASNHQSWVDIVVLQRVFNRRIPFLKFFIKHVLIWVPFLGQAWWAMDMPFMKRYSRKFLEKNPHLKGKDLEATRKSCERFAEVPTSVINFVEGTRFTAEKHAKTNSPYTNLLPPRAGGIAFALSVMGEQFRSLLDVTIVYPGGSKSFWQMCTGELKDVVVDVREISIEPWMSEGDYLEDAEFRGRFQTWLTALWVAKDQRFAELDKLVSAQSAGTEED